jgi:hypothetical protein
MGDTQGENVVWATGMASALFAALNGLCGTGLLLLNLTLPLGAFTIPSGFTRLLGVLLLGAAFPMVTAAQNATRPCPRWTALLGAILAASVWLLLVVVAPCASVAIAIAHVPFAGALGWITVHYHDAGSPPG